MVSAEIICIIGCVQNHRLQYKEFEKVQSPDTFRYGALRLLLAALLRLGYWVMCEPFLAS
jgi:hypothetical protein